MNLNYLSAGVLKGFDEDLASVLKEYGGFIAGGAFTSVATNTPINDYDIYFKSKEALGEAVALMKNLGYHCAFISEKSVTFKIPGGGVEEPSYQFIYYDFYESVEDIFNHYDFTINMCGYDFQQEKVILHDNFLLHNSQRYLSFNTGTKFPIISALRIQKYKERGYNISRTEFVKMMFAINRLEITSWKEFKNQCGNLYGFNFMELSEDEMKEEFSMDKALDRLSNVSFDGCSVGSSTIPYEVLELVLGGMKVCKCEHKNNVVWYTKTTGMLDVDLDNYPSVLDSLEIEEVSLKKILGDHVYKWVRKDLCSHWDENFQYRLGVEATPKYPSGYGSAQVLFASTLKGLDGATYADSGVVIKCEYDEEDVVSFSDERAITLNKLTPVEIFEHKSKTTRHLF